MNRRLWGIPKDSVPLSRTVLRWGIRVLLLGCLLWVSLGIGACQVQASRWGEEQQLIAQAWAYVDRAYVDPAFNGQNWWQVRQRVLSRPLSERQQTYHAIEEMLATLGDPFTRFLDKEHYLSLQTSTAGELSGIGLQIAIDDQGSVRVIAPMEGTPAEQAGIQSQDEILEVNQVSVSGLSLDEVAERMRGRSGTPVTLKVKRQDRVWELELVRQSITINPVRTRFFEQPQGSIAYIRLSQFNGNAAAQVKQAIRTAEAQAVRGYILDLRNNPGGLLQAAIEIGRFWIPSGDIVRVTDRHGIQDSIPATGDILTEAPLVVLVNQGSASASEVLAGALQDNRRAQLVGTRTFGKGLIQSLLELADGSGLAVTTAKYLTPNGHDIHRQGIQPDVVVAEGAVQTLAGPEDVQLQRALQLFGQQMPLAEGRPVGQAA
ncbi:S41 family peptidase [Synechococcus sp. Nb3U1]|uniref:S41 family peptidase n=1 Tax=Synechococcus sp. Nb3U1 TaxID=1914529 RepID=UPI001F1DA59E|nr:S41 family peptidase [Synechococcus sp. Nb3U1]MCF2970034.1 S41 family peptidase [Synechococcus sp. Nb3U1]